MDATATVPRRDLRVIGLVGSGHFLSHMYTLALPSLFPLLKVEFGVSYAALGMIMTAFASASGLGQLPMGFVVDRFGARFVLIGGLTLISSAILLAGLAPTFYVLPILFFLAGLGNSVFHPADYAILASAVRPDRVGRAFSLHTFAGYGGWAAAPPLMILLSTLWDWRLAVMLVGGAGLALALVMLWRRDLLVMAPPGAPRKGRRGGHFAILLRPGILFLFGFFVLSAMTTVGINTFSVSALVALHGVTLSAAGAALTVFLVAASTGVLAGGPLADYTSRYELVATVGFICAAAAIATVGLFPISLASAMAALGLTGFMLGVIMPSRDMLVRAMAPRGAEGKVFGFVSTGIEIGAASSPVLFGWMIDRGTPQDIFIMSAMFMMGTLGFAVAAAVYVRRRADGGAGGM